MKKEIKQKDIQQELSEERTLLSEQRSTLAKHRTGLAEKRTDLSMYRTELSEERTKLARERNHLANERTFQAWVRTALALIGFGITINKFSVYITEKSETLPISYNNSGYSWIVGFALIITGILMLIISYRRYMIISNEMGKHDIFPSKMLIVLVWLCIIGAIGFVIFEIINML